MKLPKPLVSLVLMLTFLSGCGNNTPDAPTLTVPSTSAPVSVDPQQICDSAAALLRAQEQLTLHYTYSTARTLDGQTFTQTRSGTAEYADLLSDSREAMIQETVTFGSYSTGYITSWIDGSGYVRVSNCNFRAQSSWEDFLAQQIPAQLLDAACYNELTYSLSGTQSVITFHAPTGLEAWLDAGSDAVVLDAWGEARFSESGVPVSMSYYAHYTDGFATCTVEASVEIHLSADDFSTRQPVYPANCPEISDLQIPFLLLQTVGDVYTSGSMSAQYTDSLYFGYYAAYRTQSSEYHLWQSAEDIVASLSSDVTNIDFAGVSSSSSWNITFRDGQITEQVNGGDPTVNSSLSAQQIRIQWEDHILSALLPLDYIQSASLTDTGDFLYIHFEANADFVSNITSSIYQLYQVSLDSWADSHTTEKAGAYLTISKSTGLPTAMGLYLERTHIISGVPFTMTYQADQSVSLACPDTYTSITGEQAPGTNQVLSTQPLLYRITDADGRQIWILGTTDIGDSRTAGLADALQEVLQQIDAIAVEYDADAFSAAVSEDPALQTRIAQLYYNTDVSLAERLPAQLHEKLYPLMLATGATSDSSDYLDLSVWYSLIRELYLQQDPTLTAQLSIQAQLLRWADAQQLPVYESASALSALENQIALPAELKTALLQMICDSTATQCSNCERGIYEAILTANPDTVRDALDVKQDSLSSLYPQYRNELYAQRIAASVAAAGAYLQSGEAIVYILDVSLLFGDENVLDALRAQGYLVELVSQ